MAGPYLGWFTDEPAVRAAAWGPFLAYCAFLPVDALGAALAKVLVATGSATYVMLAELVAALGVFLPVSILAGPVAGGGAWGVWAGFGAYICVFTTLVLVRIKGSDPFSATLRISSFDTVSAR